MRQRPLLRTVALTLLLTIATSAWLRILDPDHPTLKALARFRLLSGLSGSGGHGGPEGFYGDEPASEFCPVDAIVNATWAVHKPLETVDEMMDRYRLAVSGEQAGGAKQDSQRQHAGAGCCMGLCAVEPILNVIHT